MTARPPCSPMPAPSAESGSRRALLGQLARRASALGLAALAGPLAWAEADGVCGSAPPPPYPSPQQPPLLQTWLQEGRRDGPAPDCGALRDRDFALAVRVVASYLAPGDLTTQLARFGAVSTMKGMSYWSFSDHRRQVLLRESYAVAQAGDSQPRADYTLADLRRGNELCFVHADNRSSAAVPYAMWLAAEGPQGFTMRFDNVGPVRLFGFPIVAAREIQWSVSIERLGGGRYGWHSLLGVRRLRVGRAEQHRLSNLARAVAMFDLMSGRQTDLAGLG